MTKGLEIRYIFQVTAWIRVLRTGTVDKALSKSFRQFLQS